MSGFFNNFYYGKAGKADYTPDQLPKNRVQLFFSMLRIRFTGIIGMSLMYTLFCLPAIIWTLINLSMISLVFQGDASVLQEGMSGTSSAMGYLNMYLLIMIPLQGLCGVGATGQVYVLRNWARDQHSFVMSDFKDSLKTNWKQGLVIGLLNGLSLYVVYVAYFFYGGMSGQNVLFIVPQMFVLVAGAVWWMMNMVIFPMMVTYEMKLRHLIRNALIMVVGRLPFSVLFWVGSLVIPVLISLFIAPQIMILVYAVIGFGLTGFVYASYANSCFDKFLNPQIQGAEVNRGLRDPIYDEWDKDEDEEEGGQ